MKVYLKYIWFFFLAFTVSLNAKDYSDSLKLGEKYLKNENYLKAFSFFLNLSSELEDSKIYTNELAYSYMYLGICYEYFEYGDKSQEYLKKAIVLFENINDLKGFAYARTYLGDIIEDDGKVDEAFKSYKEALNYFSSNLDEAGEALVYDNMASSYENVSKFDSALFVLEKAKHIYTKQKNALGIAQVLNDCGDVLRKWNKPRESLKYYQEAYSLSMKINSEEEQRSNLRDIAKTYAMMGNFKDAYISFEKFYEVNWKLKFDKKIDDITQMHVSQMQLRKNHEIELLREKQHVEQVIYIGIVFASVLIVVFGIVLFVFWQVKRKKEIELENVQKNLLISELKSSELERQNLEKELIEKKQGLSDFTKILIERNEHVEQLKRKLSETLDKQEVQKSIRNKMIEELADTTILTDEDWKLFKKKFDDVYPDFFISLKNKYPELTMGDQRMIAVIKLNLSQKDMASMFGVSEDSVKKAKQRLRIKVSTDDSFKLKDWIESL
ncbi:MAG: tetratricopeptide repeat protein [Cytophagales bacterium]